ncbi:MAG TPA: hypothetical protein VEK55_03900 [Xanthobacteraceae bacterium]|nr:hypothetical protein [Xanthobacteraceae bacterium]
MPRIRILALVTAVAIAAPVLGSSIHACDDRSATGCERALTPSGPPPEAFAQRPSKPHHGRRPAPHVDPSPNVTTPSLTTQAGRDNGISAQQFQRFVSKQSITASAQQLRSPWLEPAQLAVSSTHPVSGGIIAASDDEPTNNLKQPTANEVAVDGHNDLGDQNRGAAGEKRTAALQSRGSDNGPLSVSWVEFGFLVWGGLLTVGSGLRLIFG